MELDSNARLEKETCVTNTLTSPKFCDLNRSLQHTDLISPLASQIVQRAPCNSGRNTIDGRERRHRPVGPKGQYPVRIKNRPKCVSRFQACGRKNNRSGVAIWGENVYMAGANLESPIKGEVQRAGA